MAVRDLIKDVFDTDEVFDIQEAIKRLQRKKGTISSALSRGVKTDDFKRVSRGIYQTLEKWFRKTIGSLFYCGGKKWIYTAWTFEENNEDRKDWLRVQLESDLEDECSEERQFMGYESKSVNTKDVDQSLVYDAWDYTRTSAR